MLHKIKDIKICVSFCAQYIWRLQQNEQILIKRFGEHNIINKHLSKLVTKLFGECNRINNDLFNCSEYTLH